MNEKGPWTLGLMAIVIAALVARGVLPQGAASGVERLAAETPKEKADEEQEKKEKKEQEVWTEFCPAPCLYEEFFGRPISPADADWKAAAEDIAKSAGKQEYELKFLIVLVPDPVDSHLSNLFDEALDALQRGMAESGYLFDRISLPWEGAAAEKRLYRSVPGSLLFRKGGEEGSQKTLLGVLLVGESPKGGIQKRAFFTALDFITALPRKKDPQGDQSDVQILGPSFSGSAESLRIALREWHSRPDLKGTPFQVKLVSGSATAPGLETFFNPPKKQEDEPAPEPAPVIVEFERTTLADNVLKEQAFKFLSEKLGWDLKDMALITEFDTDYGRELSRWAGLRERSLRTVQFPSNLAHIRTAREKLGLDRDPSSSDTPVAARKNLDLTLADHDKPVDVVPQLNELSTQSNDLGLAGLLRGISRSRYIGILATDLQDKLFLAEQVHNCCPDAVVFTFDNHLLNAHPKVAKSMDGTLVLTNFPLYPSWERASRQFTSEFQQGIYLAALHLLKGKQPVRGKQPVNEKQPLASAVWVAAVGNGALWPIAGLSEKGRPLKEFPPLRGADRAGSKWLVAALAIALLTVWISRLARPVQEPVEARKVVFLPALGAGVPWLASGVLMVFYALPLCHQAQLPGWQAGLWGLNLALLVLVYLGTTLVFARLVWPPRRWGRAPLWVAAGVLVPVLLGWAMRKLWLFPEGDMFFSARAGDFSSGLSPLVSLALLGVALYAWAVVELKRRRLTLVHHLSWPLPFSPEPALADCGRHAREVWKRLVRSPGKAFWMAAALGLFLTALRLFGRIQPIAEARGYGVFFVIAVMFVFLLSALSFYRFFRAWRRLECVLGRLCGTWMLPVFSRASDLLDWQPLKSFGLRMPSIKMTLVSAQQLRTIARFDFLGFDGAALADGIGEPRGALDERLDHLFKAEEEGRVLDEIEARRELQTWFDAAARFLERVRWSSGSADRLPDDEEGKAVARRREVEMREIETYLAIRVVAYLRYVFAHLRYALASATICGLTLLVAVSSYAFQPKRCVSFGIWMTLLLASAMTLRVFMQMDRNGTLSAIGGTDAGKVSLDRTFFSNLLTYGGIPVIGVLLTQFPAVGHVFGNWLGPLLRVVGGGG